ncbi:hypothetical protein F0L68_18240 [Solihabitans fulvus]|uniref:Uncharacterized protein n=1 Tax=Solihabitans fulvus TaxID=1892852 RepID=A0A5B2XDU8_9PSEU|nr:hypothetical protein [Solihabitans fulvus]KAA2261170.1 hypothetical protein F0L68_18240 [Solihabitans fulvus]
MTPQPSIVAPDAELAFYQRIRHLAQRAERTAHDRFNIVGPPPSQEHLDILAEMRTLTEGHLAAMERIPGHQPSQPRDALPQPRRDADCRSR